MSCFWETFGQFWLILGIILGVMAACIGIGRTFNKILGRDYDDWPGLVLVIFLMLLAGGILAALSKCGVI
jgi:hypothetical protein